MFVHSQNYSAAKNYSVPRKQSVTENMLNEVLDFLYQEPLKNSVLIGLILENGLKKSKWQGEYFVYYNENKEMEGVALIGSKLFFHAVSDEALYYFLEKTTAINQRALGLCEPAVYEKIAEFLKKNGRDIYFHCVENLMVKTLMKFSESPTNNFRPASLKEIDLVLKANAEIIMNERNVNPMKEYPKTFKQAHLDILRQKRTLIWVENKRLISKIDIHFSNKLATYLEGFYVNPEERSKGIGFKSLQEISDKFVSKSKFLTLLVDEKNQSANRLYEKIGFRKFSQFCLFSIIPA